MPAPSQSTPASLSTLSTGSASSAGIPPDFLLDYTHKRASDHHAVRTVYCARSGVPLAEITALCSMSMPFVSDPAFNCVVHPVYNLKMDALLVRTSKLIKEQEDGEYLLPPVQTRELSLCMSAIMYGIEAIYQAPPEAIQKHPPSLPSASVTIGCASRLLVLAKWFNYLTSKRIGFPIYRVSKNAGNLEWENYAGWLDAAFEIRAAWASKKEAIDSEELLRVRSAALVSIKSENIYKRIDVRKVWNWIDVQLAADDKKRYPVGRRETLKAIFMSADTNPEDWVLDDIEDLSFAVLNCCDMGNEISHFINKRISDIKSVLLDFYGSFTMLSINPGAAGGHAELNDSLTSQEQALRDEYDVQAAALTSLPAAPERAGFPSLGAYLKAQAQHNILARRFAARGV